MTKWIGSCGRVLARLLSVQPQQLKWAIGDFLGLLWFDVFRIRRKVVLQNLRIAFPEWTEKKRIQVGRRSLFNLGRDLIEYSELPFLTKERARQKTIIEGEHHLTEALDQKKGVALLTLHLGNGDFAIGALSVMGYPMYLISKEFKLGWLNRLWFGMRAKLGTHFIPPRNSSYSVLKALKKNGVVVFVLDQFTGPPIGVKTRFFGVETGTGVGLATVAQRSGCPVVPVYTFRRGDGKHVIHFDSPIELAQEEDRDKGLVLTTQKYNDQLETYVRRHPEQWMWIHKRWKKHIVR